MAIATAFGWGNAVQIVLAIVLAFVFGYALTLRPVLARRRRLSSGERDRLRVGHRLDRDHGGVDNVFVLLVPGAIDAGLGDAKFWWSIALGFAIAFPAALAANRWLIARGKGHAVVHQYHH